MYYYVPVLLSLCSLVYINHAEDILTELGCEGEKIILTCPKGYTIDVKTTFYGKKNPLICHGSLKKPAHDCSAGSALDIVKFKCNLKETCTVYASNYLFGDPCPETLKYLEITYDCTKAGEIQTKNACEHELLDLNCPEGTYLWITNALYGRTNQLTCSGPDLITRTNHCQSDNALTVVELKCDNVQECQIKATNEIFGDPCPGTFKYLQVNYQCLSREFDATTTRPLTSDNNSVELISPVELARNMTTINVNETKMESGNQINAEEEQNSTELSL